MIVTIGEVDEQSQTHDYIRTLFLLNCPILFVYPCLAYFAETKLIPASLILSQLPSNKINVTKMKKNIRSHFNEIVRIFEYPGQY
jgi:hypothetical protein